MALSGSSSVARFPANHKLLSPRESCGQRTCHILPISHSQARSRHDRGASSDKTGVPDTSLIVVSDEGDMSARVVHLPLTCKLRTEPGCTSR